MFTYNITFIVETSIFPTWLKWTEQQFNIKKSTLNFSISHKWLQLLDSPNEGTTVCLQLFLENSEILQKYKTETETQFDQEMWQQFPNQYVCYKSTLQDLIL